MPLAILVFLANQRGDNRQQGFIPDRLCATLLFPPIVPDIPKLRTNMLLLSCHKVEYLLISDAGLGSEENAPCCRVDCIVIFLLRQ